MLKRLLVTIFYAGCIAVNAQTTLTESFYSKSMEEDRTIRVYLPQSFEKSENNSYNLILTLDGEYLFYATIGNTEFLASKGLGFIPGVIVVGIDQNYENEDGYEARQNDCDYNKKTGLPEKKGIKFFTFITDELLPYLEKNIG